MEILSYFKTAEKELTAYYDIGEPRIININKVEAILQEWLEYNQWIIDHGLKEDPNYVMKDIVGLENDLNYFNIQLIEPIPIPIYKNYAKIGIYCVIAELS